MKHSFEYCSLRYLLQWETEERALYERMTNEPTEQDLRKSLQHFRVVRSFKGIGEEGKATSILGALRRVGNDATLSPSQKVLALASRFQADFDHFNLSAASKLLWLTFRSPYIIYDARAVAALRLLGCQFDNKAYADYDAAWHSKYDEYKSDITLAAQQLTKLQPFIARWHENEDSLTALANEPWFLERIFDNYLWYLGDAEQFVWTGAAVVYLLSSVAHSTVF